MAGAGEPAEAMMVGVRSDDFGAVAVDADVTQAARLLDDASDVTLLAHVNPDADALGSALALGLALHRRGSAVRVSFGGPSDLPESLRDLDVAGLLVPAEQVPSVPPLLVAMDTGSLGRLGTLQDRAEATMANGGQLLVVDHHVSNTRFGTHNLVDDRAEATAVIVLRLLDELGVPLDEHLARCLYAGLVTDTRLFRDASGATHRLAARLLDAGVDPVTTTKALLDTHPFGWLGMLATVLGRARLEHSAARGLGLVHVVVTLADSDGLRYEEVESVVDVVRTTAEAEVTAVLKEAAPAQWLVSLRADGRLDVGWAAADLGGGGHRLASGYSAHGPAEQVLAALRATLDRAPLL